MVINFLIILLFILINYIYGCSFLNNSTKSCVGTISFLIGLNRTTALAAVLSLFMPLGAVALAIIALPALGLAAWQARAPALARPPLPTPVWILLALFLAAVLHNAALPVANFDTGLYHAQFIQWLEKFPAVPGLANLHGRFGFNSNWFVTNAWTSLSFLNLADFHMPTAALFAVVLGGMLVQVTQTGQDDPQRVGRIFGVLLVPAAFYTLASEISSPGTDLPTALLVWACAWLLLAEPDSTPKWLALLLTPVLAVTVKLAALPLIGFSVAALFQLWKTRQRRAAWVGITAAGLILLPWLARNVILTGYLVYPQTALDLFSVDWKVPLESVAAERDAVIAWGRLPGLPIDQTVALPFQAWVKPWFADLSTGQQALVAAGFFSPLPIAWYALRRPGRWASLQVAAILFAGLVYWLLSAPAIRFGYGYILGLVALAAACGIDLLTEKSAAVRTRLPAVLGTLVAAYLIFFLIQSFDRRVLSDFAVLPAPYPNLPTAPCQITNTTIFIGQEYQQCWDAPLPCAPYCNPNLSLRGNSLAEGFYIP